MYEFDNIEDFLNANPEFPYKKLYYTPDKIREMFNNLKTYNVKTRLVNKPYKLRHIIVDQKKMLFRGKYCLILSRESDYKGWNILSDMFQEHCRMKCRVIETSPSPLEYWNENKERIGRMVLEKYGKITPNGLRETIYQLVRECTSHRPNNMLAMIQLFGAKSVLDISSGWGDRLLGAMAAEIPYLGVDPNACLHEGYGKMIDMFGGEGGRGKYKVIEGEFEKIDFKDLYEKGMIGRYNFDLVYTSPPYFDLEIYTTTSPQSNLNYRTETVWFEKFLKPSIETCWKMLNDNGVMAININHKGREDKYVNMMIDLIDKLEGAVYIGLISYANQDIRNPQPIWCWKKSLDYQKYKDRYMENKN